MVGNKDKKRAILNTTIKEDILSDFRNYCKKINCPMNMVLEIFMEQFAEGQFSFKLSKGKTQIDFEE